MQTSTDCEWNSDRTHHTKWQQPKHQNFITTTRKTPTNKRKKKKTTAEFDAQVIILPRMIRHI